MITNATGLTAVPDFEVLDHGETRTDLAHRKEIKYTIAHADIGTLRGLLATNCRRLVHNEAVSTVRSIYFDDARLSACRANLDGLGRRRKVRLRWYDTLLPGTEFFFEVKWRNNRVTGKHRLGIRSPDPLSSLTYRQVMDGLERALPARLVPELWQSPEPVMIVQYKREHFASHDGSLRVTLDYDLTYYDQTGRRSISTDFRRRFDPLVVLEGKTPVGRERELVRLLFPLSGRAGRCSKYVYGCQLLGLISLGI